MDVEAIVAAAGSGTRLGGGEPKPFVSIHGRPLVIHTLGVFEQCPSVRRVIVAAHPDCVDRMRALIRQAGFKKEMGVVAGGEERGCSVRNALDALDARCGKILVHDGARPLITAVFVEEMIAASTRHDALIAAVPVKPTIKRADPGSLMILETLDRACLWEVQTPQIFSADVLARAYAAGGSEATDDAALVERLGIGVKIFPGLEQNIKITTTVDLLLARGLLQDSLA